MNEDPWAAFNPTTEAPPPVVPPPSITDAPVPGQAQDPYAAYAPRPAPVPTYRGSILPVTKYSDDSWKFDPMGSGITGSFVDTLKKGGNAVKQAWTEGNKEGFNPGDTMSMATVLNPVNPAIKSGDKIFAGAARNAPDLRLAKTPSSAKLKEEGGKQLDTFREMPIEYNPAAFRDFAVQAEQELADKGIFRENSPGLYKSLDRLRDITPKGGGDPTIHAGPPNLIAIRENIASHFGAAGEHQRGVGAVFERFNKFIEAPPEGAVLAGSPAAEGAALYAKGRANYAAGSRGEGLEDIKHAADIKGTDLRSRVASHVLDQRKTKGYTDAEVAQLEQIPLGTTSGNVKNWVGRTLGSSGGLPASMAVNTVSHVLEAMGIPGASNIAMAAPAAGQLLTRSAGKGTREAFDEAIKTQQQRSPLFREGLSGQDLIPNAHARDRMAQTLQRLMIQQREGVPVEKPVMPYDPNFL